MSPPAERTEEAREGEQREYAGGKKTKKTVGTHKTRQRTGGKVDGKLARRIAVRGRTTPLVVAEMRGK